MRHGLDVGTHQRTVYPYPNTVVKFLDIDTDLPHFAGDRLQMLRNDIGHQHVALGGSGSDHKCARFDLIRNDGIHCTVQPFYAADLDDIGTCTHDLCTHRVQEVCQIDDVRFLGGVFNDSQTLGTDCCQHGIHRGTNGNHI